MRCLIAILFCWAAQAKEIPEIKFGPEFTFAYTEGPTKNWNMNDLIIRMNSHLVNGQPAGAQFSVNPNQTKFTSPNGWWVEVTMDQGVVESKMSPMTVSDWKKYSDDVQDALFVSAANEDLFPSLYLGGGHINVDTTELLKKPLLLRNFVVDFMNHNELYMGIFNYDTNSALPFSLLEDDLIAKYQALIASWDTFLRSYKYEIENSPQEQILKNMFELPYQVRDLFTSLWYENGGVRAKCVAMRFFTDGMNRLEIRSVRPQKNMDVWVRQISLINSRIKYLAQLTKPIPFEFKLKHPKPVTPEDAEYMQLTPPVDPQMALQEFYRYVTESGEKWQNHRDYIWPKWAQDGELTKFESSEWFKAEQKKCGAYL